MEWCHLHLCYIYCASGITDNICCLRSVVTRQHSWCRESVCLVVSVQHSSLSTDNAADDDRQHCSGKLSIFSRSTLTQYDRLLPSYCHLSVCLSVLLCIVALRVGVGGWKFHHLSFSHKTQRTAKRLIAISSRLLASKADFSLKLQLSKYWPQLLQPAVCSYTVLCTQNDWLSQEQLSIL